MKNSTGSTPNPNEGVEKRIINPELWQACAGPLVNLPAAGTHVVYFPQGHSEQVAASMKKDVDAQIPNYPNLQSKLLCVLHNVTLHADTETDEVYAQMTLQPVPSFDREALLRSDLLMKAHKPQTEFFCKTLTASDTSTHGGFSVPRRAAEKIFPPLDFSMQPPAQELVARDLHDNVWTFRHIYLGQPKRHLLTTGWSLFVSGKRLFAGDSVLFIRDEKQQLLLGIRRANRQPANLSSSVLSSDSMHIGILAAAAHAAANNSPFTVFYNPRASPSEFVIPLAKYYKAVCSNQIFLGMRFRMMFETEESGTRRYMGTITGINDLDGVRWKNSQWRNLQVCWDEAIAGERRNRVSIWEIEPVTAPFLRKVPKTLMNYHGFTDISRNNFRNQLQRVLPAVGVYTVQCANCFKWRLVPTQEKYEEIREHITQYPFVCERALEWGSDVSCDDPPDIEQDGSRLWAIDKPNIAQTPPGWHRDLRIRSEGSTKFGDIYYTSPTGVTLRSKPEVEKYLFQHPEYMEQGVSLAQFSFRTPKPLQENYVRKRPARVSAIQDGNFMGMPGSVEPLSARPLALPGPEQNTDLQLGVPGFSTPYAFNPSPKKPRSSPAKRRHNFDLMFKHHEM